MDPISSRSNPTIVAAARFRRDRPEGLCLVEGPVACQEALEAGIAFDRLFVVDGDERGMALADIVEVAPLVVTADVFAKVADTETPQSPVAVVRIPESGLKPGRAVVVLWDLADPGNTGTLIRTAAAFGLQVLVVAGADPWAPKCMRAAAGGHFRTAVVRVDVDDAADVLEAWDWFAAVPRGGENPAVLGISGAPAIIVGNEAHGLPGTVIERSRRVSIPMVESTESLNAAQAGAMLMWEWRKTASR